MDKRFLVCGLAVSLAALALGFLVHGVLLRDDYLALAGSGLVRGPEDGRGFVPLIVLAHTLAGFGMTWLYRQVVPAGERSMARALRFAAAFAIAATLPAGLVAYAVQPWPTGMVAAQLVYSTASVLVLGLLLGYLHPRRSAL